MKKVVISTFNNSLNNYGALFQSCALVSFLNDLGYDTYNVTLLNRSGNGRKSKKQAIKIMTKKIVLLPHLTQMKRRKEKFIQFSKETQKQLIYSNLDELLNNPPVADVYISGSDQVFNPVNIHEDFFLSYAPANALKIAYAASMGNERVPDSNLEQFRSLLSNFNNLSVREDSMIEILQHFTDKPVCQNVDPVFLLPRQKWISFSSKYDKLKYEKFILVYAIQWSKQNNDELAAFKKKVNLPVISINLGNVKNICADQVLYDVSPREFLDILSRSEYVVASSFHGVSLSIVFNKNFVACIGDKPERINSVLRHFGLTNRIDFSNLDRDIDYGNINNQIAEDQINARKYFNGSIG